MGCTKKEKAPAPQGAEMESYEEEIEIVPDAPAQSAPVQTEKVEEKKESKAAVVESKAAEPEPEPEEEKEPEPEPTPPPPEGPLKSKPEHHKSRLKKCKKLPKLWEQSKPLDKGIIKEYD